MTPETAVDRRADSIRCQQQDRDDTIDDLRAALLVSEMRRQNAETMCHTLLEEAVTAKAERDAFHATLARMQRAELETQLPR